MGKTERFYNTPHGSFALILRRLLFMVLVTLISHPLAKADVTSGLIGYWRLDETSGTTATASVGGVNGTLTNYQASPWVTGTNAKIDGALYANNANNTRVDLGDNFDFNGSATFSLAMWFMRSNATGNANQTLMGKTLTDGSGKQGWILGICNGCGVYNRGLICERYLNGTSQASTDLSGDLPLREWVHAVCTYDGSYIRIYRNGVLVDTSASSALSMNNHTASAFIGNANSNTTGSPTYNTSARAYYDDVRIYNRALTAKEIMTLSSPCTSVDSGKIDYFSNASDKSLRYCNAKYWESMSSRTAGAACTQAGQWFFESTSNVMMFCDGANTFNMGPTSAGGSGCSSPTGAKGALYYDSSNTIYKYCNGASWVDVGS